MAKPEDSRKIKVIICLYRTGGVLKVVREHYLRDDIWCGSPLCKECGQEKPVLEECPVSHSSFFSRPHYIVPDTNVVLHQADVLEHKIIKNAVILQVVLQEVRHRSPPSYKKVKDMLANPDKHFYSLVNEHHKDMYIERVKGESSNDRNDRAIRQAVKWYRDHLSGKNIDIVLLTDDVDNKTKAINDGLGACTVSEYVESLKKCPEIVDLLAITGKQKVDSSYGKFSFPEHLPLSEIQKGIRSGKYVQGTFRASRDNYLEATVSSREDKPIFLQGHDSLNRAVNEDVVAVEILPESDWTCPSSIVLEDATEKTDEEQTDEEKLLKSKNKERQVTGRVVGIIKRKWRQYCGILQPSLVKGSTRHLFVPAERRIPKIRIETRQADTLKSQRIVVSIDSWPRYSRYPQGHFVRRLGEVGDKETENEVLLLEHDVPHNTFSQEVLSFLPEMPWTIKEEDMKRRRDLRHLCICSVDPPGCTDIDDALHFRNLDNGNVEVGVHIADVTHFIRPGNAMDKEAANRGTTVYLIDKRIDMVPELLSSNLCSLRSNVDRFAFSVLWEIDNEAKIVNTQFMKSVISSRASFTYAEAQMIIDDKKRQDDTSTSLRGLNRLAKILKKRRIENGALTLASPEIRFHIDSETHDPIDVETKELRETNSMVEEFMLLANISVAQKIYDDFPDCAVLRRHPCPPPSNFEPLVKAAQSKGFELDISSGKGLALSLEKAVIPDDKYFNTMLRIQATRCMMQAVYFSSGTIPEADFVHYGLATPIYTHFTSPIRRYSDVMVHRLLAVAIGADSSYPDLLEKLKSEALCQNLNFRHRMAQYAGRASVGLHTQIFFKNRIVDEEGYVLFVRKNALQVLIPKYGLEGTVFVSESNKVKGPFTYNDTESSQVAGDVVLKVFSRVIVQISIDASDIQHQKLALKLVEPKIPGFSVPSCAQLDVPEPPRKRSRKT